MQNCTAAPVPRNRNSRPFYLGLPTCPEIKSPFRTERSLKTLSGESGVTTATLRTRQRLQVSSLRLPSLVPSRGKGRSLPGSLPRLCNIFIALSISLSCIFLTYGFLTTFFTCSFSSSMLFTSSLLRNAMGS